MGEGEAGAERHLGADDAVPAVEALLAGEHVHRAALALGVAAAAPGQLGHDAARVHVAGQHVAVVAVAGDDAVARAQRMLDADGDRLLADIEVAEAADQAHAVELARPSPRSGGSAASRGSSRAVPRVDLGVRPPVACDVWTSPSAPPDVRRRSVIAVPPRLLLGTDLTPYRARRKTNAANRLLSKANLDLTGI